jgi:hypothetical protein
MAVLLMRIAAKTPGALAELDIRFEYDNVHARSVILAATTEPSE